MPQEYKDATYSNNTGLNGQVAPTLYFSPGEQGIIATTAVTGQLTTQVNPQTGVGILGGLSNVQAEQQLFVIGQTYNSPGGILNKAPATGTLVTGVGGP